MLGGEPAPIRDSTIHPENAASAQVCESIAVYIGKCDRFPIGRFVPSVRVAESGLPQLYRRENIPVRDPAILAGQPASAYVCLGIAIDIGEADCVPIR